jgi:hypothetical protein
MSSRRIAQQRELPKARQRRLQRTLMEHYANEPTYTKEVDRLRHQWKAFGRVRPPAFTMELENLRAHWKAKEEFDRLHSAFRPTIATSVAQTLRLVDRDRERPLEWAIDWVDDDVLELSRVWGRSGVELRNSTGEPVSFRRFEQDREAYRSLFESMPKFTLSVTLETVGLAARGFDPWVIDPHEEREDEDFEFEHEIFNGEITSETWKELETLSQGLLKEGVKRMRAMFEEQFPSEYITRPGGRESESNALQLLCQYLLSGDYNLFEKADSAAHAELSVEEYDAQLRDSTEPGSARQARELCSVMGIFWPNKSSH